MSEEGPMTPLVAHQYLLSLTSVLKKIVFVEPRKGPSLKKILRFLFPHTVPAYEM